MITLTVPFYTYKKLQGSQTILTLSSAMHWFYTYKKLQGSQTTFVTRFFKTGFTLIKNYKALKPICASKELPSAFYTYKKLQGSQTYICKYLNLKKFYTYKKLQGSQTDFLSLLVHLLFYTYKKLQGSQTSNGHHRTYIPGGIVTSDIFILQLNTCLCL